MGLQQKGESAGNLCVVSMHVNILRSMGNTSHKFPKWEIKQIFLV